MGVSYEVNWYLVVGNESDLLEISPNKFIAVKTEKRIYPIGVPIPLILKKNGCIGMVELDSIKIAKENTDIEFTLIKRFTSEDVIAKHYYDMYKSIKEHQPSI